MSKGDTWENDLLKLLFNATAITGLADNAGTGPITNLYVALHTADPGETGAQTASEVAYTGYARVAVARSGAGWVVTANSVSPASPIAFPACTAGTATATHFSVGTSISGAGKLLYSGPLTPQIAIAAGVTPELTTSTIITED